VKRPIGIELTLNHVLDLIEGCAFDYNDEETFTFDNVADNIVVIVGGKKVDPKKVKIKLTEDV
jgi:hypothetical protein